MPKIKTEYSSSKIKNPCIPEDKLEKQRPEMVREMVEILGQNKRFFELTKDSLDLSLKIEEISKKLDTYWKDLEELSATDLKGKIHNINFLAFYVLNEPLDYSQTWLTKEQIKEQEESNAKRLIDAYENVFHDRNFNVNSQNDRMNLKKKINEAVVSNSKNEK